MPLVETNFIAGIVVIVGALFLLVLYITHRQLTSLYGFAIILIMLAVGVVLTVQSYREKKLIHSINSYGSCIEYDGPKVQSEKACSVKGKIFYKESL